MNPKFLNPQKYFGWIRNDSISVVFNYSSLDLKKQCSQ